MWLIFAALSLLLYAAADIFAKKRVNAGNAYTPLELCVTVCVISFIIGMALYVCGFGESGMAPWHLLRLHPLIIANLLCFFLYWVFYLLSMHFIRLSIAEAISGSAGVFYFVGLLLINLCLGKLPAVRDMLHPLRLIPVILVLTFIFLYPFAEPSERKIITSADTDRKKSQGRYIIAVCILLLSLIADSFDSLITTLVIGDGNIGIVDYIMASYFSVIFPALILFIFLCVKRKKWFIPLKQDPFYSAGYAVSALLASQLFLISSYYDAVRTGILFIAYPIVPIIGAKVFLKEKFTRRQNLCVWMITVSAIAFCIFDNLL